MKINSNGQYRGCSVIPGRSAAIFLLVSPVQVVNKSVTELGTPKTWLIVLGGTNHTQYVLGITPMFSLKLL